MDAYQQAVEYLTANPEQIIVAWSACYTAPGGCLFHYVEPTHTGAGASEIPHCGCLSMITMKSMTCWRASDDALTAIIRQDARLPTDNRITPDHLPIFAGWQRRIDQILGRTPPAMDPRIPLPTGDIEIPEVTPASWSQRNEQD